MDRVPLALADTIESLRNDVELMWSDIQHSFDRIDREIGRSIIKYGPTTFDPSTTTTNITHNTRTEMDPALSDTRLRVAGHPVTSFMSPIQAQLSEVLRRSPAQSHPHSQHDMNNIAGFEPIHDDLEIDRNDRNHRDRPQHRTYSTPVESHTIPGQMTPSTPPLTMVRRSTIPRFEHDSSAPSNASDNSNRSDIRSIGDPPDPNNYGLNHPISNTNRSTELNITFSNEHQNVPSLNGYVRSLPWMHPFREHPVSHRSVQLELPNLNDSPEALDVPMSRANSSETTEDHNEAHRVDLIRRISDKLRDSKLFAHQNDLHSRNNTENEEDDIHDNEYRMEVTLPTVITPHSSPPSQSVMVKKRRNSRTPDITAIAEVHEPLEYDTAVSSNGNPTDSSASSSYGRLFYSKAHSERSHDSSHDSKDHESNSSDSESTEHSNDSRQFNQRRHGQGHETHHSLRLSAPRGLAQINLQEIEQIDHDLANLKQTAPDGTTYDQRLKLQDPILNPMDSAATPGSAGTLGIAEHDGSYPGLALPAIPQFSSVNHRVMDDPSSDITSKHEKKKSMSQLSLQDLELDSKFGHQRPKHSKSREPSLSPMTMNPMNPINTVTPITSSNTAGNGENERDKPLTPLAMMTQIGLDDERKDSNHPDYYSVNDHIAIHDDDEEELESLEIKEMPDIGMMPIQESNSSLSAPSPTYRTQSNHHQSHLDSMSMNMVHHHHERLMIKEKETEQESSDYELPNTQEALRKSKTFESSGSVPSPPNLSNLDNVGMEMNELDQWRMESMDSDDIEDIRRDENGNGQHSPHETVDDQEHQIAVAVGTVPVTPGTLPASNEYVEIFHQDALELDAFHSSGNVHVNSLVDMDTVPMTVKMMNGGPYHNGIHDHEHDHHDYHQHNNNNNNNRLPMRSRESIDANHHLTDINYENNHSLPSPQINREDSNYQPMLSKDIDTILQETAGYKVPDDPYSNTNGMKATKGMNQSKENKTKNGLKSKKTKKKGNGHKTMVSPEAEKLDLDSLSYSFDQYSKNTPTILSSGDENDDGGLEDVQTEFAPIDETFLIIKEPGDAFIDEICETLANHDEFYMNEMREIQRADYGPIHDFLNDFRGQHATSPLSGDTSVRKELCRLFEELVTYDHFMMIPVYKINAVLGLFQRIRRYQTLKLEDDEASVEVRYNKHRKKSTLGGFSGHFKRPTEELEAPDNTNFDDYDEYPSDDTQHDLRRQNSQQLHHITFSEAAHGPKSKVKRERLKALFSIHKVFCPRSVAEYVLVKEILWPHTRFVGQQTLSNAMEDRVFMDSIVLIKPHAVKDCGDLIRATLVGHGFVISQCISAKYPISRLDKIVHSLDSAALYRVQNVENQALQYLSSGPILVMVVRKPIGVDGVSSNEREEEEKMRALVGKVDPNVDRDEDEFTQSIRGCFGDDLVHNVIDVYYKQTLREFRKYVQLLF